MQTHDVWLCFTLQHADIHPPHTPTHALEVIFLFLPSAVAGISYPDQPMLGSSPLDIYKLYALIKDNGGMDRVTQEMKWVSISLQMGFTSEAASAAAIRMAYKK